MSFSAIYIKAALFSHVSSILSRWVVCVVELGLVWYASFRFAFLAIVVSPTTQYMLGYFKCLGRSLRNVVVWLRFASV